MIELGEQVYFGEYTDENGARRMLKEEAKKRCHGIDESRIKLIIKEDRGYITGAWHVQVKEKEYIRMLEAQNAELVRKTEQLERERDALMKDVSGYCSTRAFIEDCEWRGAPEKPKQEGGNDV